ncbi:hypothetical protein SYNPS1DRAFT_3397, partial [Syncephalis pseudoplumigaleata]
IGPTLSATYPPLTPELEAYLHGRKEVVYVAFGSITVITADKFKAMVHSLANAYRAGLIDGVVWALAGTSADALPASIVDVAVNAAGIAVEETHVVSEMQSGAHPFIRLVDIAPQRAVLNHPAVKLFISHCGSASVSEAMDAGTPILAVPGFGDQPGNARKIDGLGAGIYVPWKDVGTAT